MIKIAIKYVAIFVSIFFSSKGLAQPLHSTPTCGQNFTFNWSSSPSSNNEFNWVAAGDLSKTFSDVNGSGVDFTMTFSGNTASFGNWGGQTPKVGLQSSGGFADYLDLFTNGLAPGTNITCTITFSSPISAIGFDLAHVNTNVVGLGNGDRFTTTATTTTGNTIYPTFTNSPTPSYTTNNATGVVNGNAASSSGTDAMVGVNFLDPDNITSVTIVWQKCSTCVDNATQGSGIGNFSFCAPQTSPPLTIDFDGVDDYINRAAFLGGKSEATMMSWIKLDNGFNGGDVMGQKNFRLFVDSNSKLKAEVETGTGTTATVNYRLDMRDSYGDGWSGKGVLITVAGIPQNGGNPFTVTNRNASESFTAKVGDIIEITFTTDQFPFEMSWDLVNTTDNVNVITNHTYNFANGIEQLSDETATCSTCPGGTTTTTAEASGVTLSDDLWYHVASAYNGSTGELKLYLNGVLQDTKSNIASNLSPNSNEFEIGRNSTLQNNYFEGSIYETRVYNKALTLNQIQRQINQKIENNAGNVRGMVIPKNIEGLSWSDLELYYKMEIINSGYTADDSNSNVDGQLNNMTTNQDYTAPLPYTTTAYATGSWYNSNNWENGNVWDIHSIPPESAIVRIKGDIEMNTDITTVGLLIDSGGSLDVNGNSGLFNSWYINLDGEIDLEGESQLIQGEDSTLDPNSAGTLERDQQGTADTYTYNYWSSPVGKSNNSTNNNSYMMRDVFTNIDFLTSGYNGGTSPVSIADYWIWKFSNKPTDDYSSWQHIRSTGTLSPGEGFTMKGPGTGPISSQQNYNLKGKPNNGDINLTINSGNDYLVGNPYPSAMDANQFILDNGATIDGPGSTTGTLYFWEHWGGGSHILREYQGGYATYSLAGGIPAASIGTSDPDVASGGTPTKIPGRYIPVAQGFFVTAETGGTIKFNNGQRVFQKESNGNSIFVKPGNNKNTKTANPSKNGDPRMKFRIGFNSVNTIHRQILITVDKKTSSGLDWGYDSKLIDPQIDDMYWLIDNEKYSIQAIDTITSQTVFPLGIHTKKSGLNSITIDKLENVPPDKNIYLHDKELGIYHDLKKSNYETYLDEGNYPNRFEITFSKSQVLDIIDPKNTGSIEAYYSNENRSIVINNPVSELIKSIEMINILGQLLFKIDSNTQKDRIEHKLPQIKTGSYVLKIETKLGTVSKKVSIQ